MFSSVYGSVRRVGRRMWHRLSLGYVYVQAVVVLWLTGRASVAECLTGRFRTRVSPWTISRVMCFREPPVTDDDDPYDLDYIEIPTDGITFDNLGSRVHREIPEGWRDWRVEVRCARGHTQKRRLVYRRGELIHALAELRQRRPYRVLTATARFGDSGSVDVHDRVSKYIIVPYRALYARDIYPMDDHSNLRGTLFLRVVSDNRLVVREYAFHEDVDLREAFASS